jgi:glucose-1-phosphate cytidylyltransferase
LLTHGDGVATNIADLVGFHREQRALATLTAVQPPGRFGALTLGSGQTHVHTFSEKPGGDGAWVNGGFFVLEPEAIDYISDDTMVWEKQPLEMLARDNALAAYKHRGFWHPDTCATVCRRVTSATRRGRSGTGATCRHAMPSGWVVAR